MDSPFDRHGPAVPAGPLIVSVPHAGRDYPDVLIDALRVPLADLLPLEDRRIDAVALAARGGAVTLVARRPRAWIDLNRAEHERDPRIDDGAAAARAPYPSPRVRGGLGLVPRRAVGGADIWKRRFGADEIAARIMADHRPYHQALDDALVAARTRFGVAVLLDLHSMPSIAGANAPAIVVGDRFGRSAAARFGARLEAVARGHGVACALNTPYAGGHIVDRHGTPARAIHALQLEIDRRLYLGPGGRALGAGFDATVALVRAMIDALVDEALPLAAAAE